MRWWLSHRCDPAARALADRHYSRGNVGAAGFVPPGRCLVLKTKPADAYWVTSYPFAEYVRHAWAGALMCSAFRNEGPHLSSELIREAVSCTLWKWPAPPLGMVTFVDKTKVRRKRDWGRCYLRAGFSPAVCDDNRPENLVVCQDHTYHMLLHRRQEAMLACGNPSWRKCGYCHTWDDPQRLYINGYHVRHRECFTKWQRENNSSKLPQAEA